MKYFYFTFSVVSLLLNGCSEPLEQHSSTSIHCVVFNEAYQTDYDLYFSKDYPEKKQVRDYFVNSVGATGRGVDGKYKTGSQFVLEVYNVETDNDGKPRSENGRLIKTELSVVSVMENSSTCGPNVPSEMRAENWTFAFFSTSGEDLSTKPALENCISCHTEQASATDFVISTPELGEFFGDPNLTTPHPPRP